MVEVEEDTLGFYDHDGVSRVNKKEMTSIEPLTEEDQERVILTEVYEHQSRWFFSTRFSFQCYSDRDFHFTGKAKTDFESNILHSSAYVWQVDTSELAHLGVDREGWKYARSSDDLPDGWTENCFSHSRVRKRRWIALAITLKAPSVAVSSKHQPAFYDVVVLVLKLKQIIRKFKTLLQRRPRFFRIQLLHLDLPPSFSVQCHPSRMKVMITIHIACSGTFCDFSISVAGSNDAITR